MKSSILTVVGLSAIASLIPLNSASAKTKAECGAQYAAKKATGETGGQRVEREGLSRAGKDIRGS